MISSADSIALTSPRPSFPGLFAGLAAFVCFIVIVSALMLVASMRTRANTAALVPMMFPEKWRGLGAQQALWRSDDVLPLYGSSELVVDMQNRATEFFGTYPTGFAVAPIGDRAYSPLSMAIAIASLGTAVRGRRVVILLSGTWFIGDDTRNDQKVFRAHYSTLQAGDVVFLSGLPIELRRRFARQVLDYEPLSALGPLLGTTLTCLARQCIFERLLPAIAPIWLLRSLPLRAYGSVQLLLKVRNATVPVRNAARVNWDELVTQGDSVWRSQSASNPLGIQDSIWHTDRARIVTTKGSLSDDQFLRFVEHAPKWQELDLLLSTLQALGARPLVLITPLKGAWWDYKGVSLAARERLYERLESATARFTFPARDFREYDGDPHFLSETRSHLSPKGWAQFDRAINAFYHDSLR